MQEKAMKMDSKDRRLLYELEMNCRRSLKELGKATGLSKQSVQYRINRFMEECAIVNFTLLVDYTKLGYVNYDVWIELGETDEAKRKKFIDHLIAHPQAVWITGTGGRFDLVLSILAKNMDDFSDIWKTILNQFPGMVQDSIMAVYHEMRIYPRTHMAGRGGKEEREESIFVNIANDIGLDSLDISILSELSKNSREPLVGLASRLKVMPHTVRMRIKKLEENGVIRAYTARIQLPKLGIQSFEILLSTRVLGEEEKKMVRAYCVSNPYTTFLLDTIGKYDLDLSFDAENIEHMQELMIELRKRFGSFVKSYEYIPVFKTYKFRFLPEIYNKPLKPQ